VAVAYASAVALTTSLNLDSSYDIDVQRAIDAASRGLDKLASMRRGGFGPDAAPSTRSYTANGPNLVVIDNLGELDTVVSDGTTITDDVTAEPLNATADGEPFRWLESAGLFATGRAAIEVTGTFGWPAVPEQVEQWVLTIATRLVKRLREAPFGLVTGSFDGEVVRLAREDPDTELLIGTLRRHRPVIV
jgi:hypothetical protein